MIMSLSHDLESAYLSDNDKDIESIDGGSDHDPLGLYHNDNDKQQRESSQRVRLWPAEGVLGGMGVRAIPR